CDLSNESRTFDRDAHFGVAPNHLRRLRSRFARQSGSLRGMVWGPGERVSLPRTQPLISSILFRVAQTVRDLTVWLPGTRGVLRSAQKEDASTAKGSSDIASAKRMCEVCTLISRLVNTSRNNFDRIDSEMATPVSPQRSPIGGNATRDESRGTRTTTAFAFCFRMKPTTEPARLPCVAKA